MKKNAGLLSALAFASISFVFACGNTSSSDDEAPVASSENVQNTQASLLEAGVAGSSLQIARWELDASGLVRARNEANEVLAEFVVDGKNAEIRSTIPDVGTRPIGATETGDFSERSSTYFEAFRADLDEHVGRTAQEVAENELQNKATYRCYHLYHDCDIQGLQGIINGWWIGYICQYPAAECPQAYYPWALRY